MDRSSGTCAAALRCRTAAMALLADVSSAKMTHSNSSTVTCDVHLVHAHVEG